MRFGVSLGLFSIALGSTAAAMGATVFDLGVPGEINQQFVTVGSPKNAPDPLTGLGSVPYTYLTGTYDVTVSQYTLMLNSVASTDPYGLWNASMSPGSTFGSCGIIRSGVAGAYQYSFPAANANFPVDSISISDAFRYINWVANGEPDSNEENGASTENGSYALNGAVTDQQLADITRQPNATYVLPNTNEWYKSAYFDSSSSTYFLYPTQSDTPPSNAADPSGTNNANFSSPTTGPTIPVIGLTPVGFFASPGPFVTYDQGGDVYQVLETPGNDEARGGFFNGPNSEMLSSAYFTVPPSDAGVAVGFRIAEVPEPGSFALVVWSAVMLSARRREP